MARPDFEKAVRELSRSIKEKQLEFQHGAVLALGYSYARRSQVGRVEDCEPQLYSDTVSLITSQLEHSNTLMVSAGPLCRPSSLR